MSITRRGRQPQTTTGASFRLSVSTSPSRSHPVMIPSSNCPTKSISDAILEGSHSALFTHSDAEQYPSLMGQNVFRQAQQQQQQQQQKECGDAQYHFDDEDRMDIDSPPQPESHNDLDPDALYLPYPDVAVPAAPTLPQHRHSTDDDERGNNFFSQGRRKSYSSQSSDTDPRLFSGEGLGINLGSRACSGGDGGRVTAAGEQGLPKADSTFEITFREEGARNDDASADFGLDATEAVGVERPCKTSSSNKSSIRSRDYKMAPTAAEMATFLKMQLAEVARQQGLFGPGAAPLTPPTTVSGASEGAGRGRKKGLVSDDQRWFETTAGAKLVEVDHQVEDKSWPQEGRPRGYADNGEDHSLTLDELLCESKYFIDYKPASFFAAGANSDSGFSFDPSPSGSRCVVPLRPEAALLKSAAPETATATARSSIHAHTLTALPFYNLGNNPALRAPRSSSAPAVSRRPTAPLCFSFNSSYQHLPECWRSCASPQRALCVEGDGIVHPALRASHISPSASSTRRASSLLTLSVRQRPRSSRPIRATKLIIPAKSEAERAAASDASSSITTCKEKHAQTPQVSNSENFDDEVFFTELRTCYRQALCRSWWRRWASARTLKWIKVTDGGGAGACAAGVALGETEKRRPRRNFVARNVKSDRSYEKALMRHYLDPEKGRGTYAWVQWARRLSIVGAIDVDEEGGFGRKNRLLPDEAGRGGLEFVEGFAVGRIALMASVVLLLGVAVLLIWTLLGPGDVLTGAGPLVESAASRVGTGVLLSMFVLLFGWLFIGLWLFLSWICA